MKMKKIIAPTMAMAMEKVKKELGKDAIIFQTRKVNDNHFFNLIKREHIEVLAAIDTETDFPLKNPNKSAEIKAEGELSHQNSSPSAMPFLRVTEKVDRLFKGPDLVEKFRSQLSGQGILEPVIDDLLKALIRKWYQNDEHLNEQEMRQLLRKEMLMKIDPARFFSPVRLKPYLMLVGPTGVGKTTTLAKLAGHAVLDERKRVALITLDTYRIAAIDQIRKYAEILHIPMETAYTAEELHVLIEKYAHYDQVFIDTAGRNFLGSEYISEIEAITRREDQVDGVLVLSATAKYEDLAQMIHSFKQAHINHFIFSKMDETTTYGNLANILFTCPDQDVLYITNGQDVPDDLAKPNLQKIIDHLLDDAHE